MSEMQKKGIAQSVIMAVMVIFAVSQTVCQFDLYHAAIKEMLVFIVNLISL